MTIEIGLGQMFSVKLPRRMAFVSSPSPKARAFMMPDATLY